MTRRDVSIHSRASRRSPWRTAILGLPALVAIGAILVGCASTATLDRVAASHPDATFEAFTRGCDRTRRSDTRRFRRLADAVSWGRSVAALAPHPPCEVTVDALSGSTRETVYHVARDAHGVWSVGPVATTTVGSTQ